MVVLNEPELYLVNYYLKVKYIFNIIINNYITSKIYILQSVY